MRFSLLIKTVFGFLVGKRNQVGDIGRVKYQHAAIKTIKGNLRSVQ